MSNNYQAMQDYFLDQMTATTENQQVGGTHYTDMSVQPWTLMESILTHEEFVGFLKGNAIKYAMRQGKKEGSDDANKSRHYLAKLKGTLCPTP